MRILAIDTATRRAGVALVEDRSPIAVALHEDPASHAERLIGLLDRALSEAGWSRGQIDLVACGVGPGSFTGVRVGLATAKGIALALDRAIVGVGSLEGMAGACTAPSMELVLSFLDARKGEIFWGGYRPDGSVAFAPRHSARSALRGELAGELSPSLLARSAFVGEIVGDLSLEGVTVIRGAATDLPDPTVLAQVAAGRFAARGSDDLDGLEPVYVRPPDVHPPDLQASGPTAERTRERLPS